MLSLLGILSGFVVVAEFLTAKRSNGWAALFLTTTVLTSVTGFLFPFHKFLPSHALGIISLIVLMVAVFALYKRRLAGSWRGTYVSTASACTVSECLRFGRTALCKGPCAKSDGTDAV